jgi:hypothetical protein
MEYNINDIIIIESFDTMDFGTGKQRADAVRGDVCLDSFVKVVIVRLVWRSLARRFRESMRCCP